MTAGPQFTGRSPRRLARLACGLALLAYLALQVLAWLGAGGVFEYPLDDVYIHLAMAEGIAAGGYGINPGEYASAASSPLYPFLLAPFAEAPLQRFYPLLWNLAGLMAAAWLWGLGLSRAGYDAPERQRIGLFLALLGPLALNFYGLAFTGMEHILHLTASLAVTVGLLRIASGGGIGALLVLGMVLAPALRLEGLALSLSAAAVIMALGRVRTGLALGLLAVLPVAGFAWFLTTLGLDPMPNSVAAKLALPARPDPGMFDELRANVRYNLGLVPGQILLGMAVLMLLVAARQEGRLRSGPRLVALALAASGLAHLVFGLVGWLNRYEPYVLASLALGLAALAAGRPRPGAVWQLPGIGAAALIFGLALGASYAVSAYQAGRWAPRGIHLQQAQMARFVGDFAPGPVAVNDIGRVAWRNEALVLDLWGLASAEARRARFARAEQHWAARMVAERGVGIVMVYADWFRDRVGPDWRELGVLVIPEEKGVLGGWSVTFYTTGPDRIANLHAKLREFARTLPAGAEFRPAEGAP